MYKLTKFWYQTCKETNQRKAKNKKKREEQLTEEQTRQRDVKHKNGQGKCQPRT